MASLNAIYVTGLYGNILVDYPLTSSPISAQDALEILADKGPNPPAIIEISPSLLLYQKSHESLLFLIPAKSETDPAIVFEFLNKIIDVFIDYFSSPLTPSKIESNGDSVALIIHQMIDGSYPFLTEPNAVREFVPYGGLLQRLLSSSSAEGALIGSSSNNSLPWRRSNVKHTRNEMFVDIIEVLDVVINATRSKKKSNNTSTSASAFYSTATNLSSSSKSKPIIARVSGSVKMNCVVSGIPDLCLELSNKNSFESPSFHPCVRTDTWKNQPGVLSFIPPDGVCELMRYTVNNLNYNGPINIELSTGLGYDQDEFEIRLWVSITKDVKYIEDLAVSIVCPSKITNIKNLRLSSGNFLFEPGAVGKWYFPNKISLGWNASLRGVLISSSDSNNENKQAENSSSSQLNDTQEVTPNRQAEFPKYVKASYSCQGVVPSGIKVESLRIISAKGLGENVKPYKGVKYITKAGNIIVKQRK